MASPPSPDPRRNLPQIDRLLADPDLVALERVYGRERLLVQAKAELAELRARWGESAPAADAADAAGAERELAELPERIARRLETELPPRLARALNATGVFLHTNLGRAPLPAEVAARLPELLTAGCDLELELASGRRGDRMARIAELLVRATGAEAALAVNNNAAALLLAIGTLAAGREVVVSRGELVEIGDSFRIPELVAAAGGRLVEVGTTNRTHLADYERAIGAETALLLKVHPSNYAIRGFVAAVSTPALAELASLATHARRHGARDDTLPLLVDEGSGLLRPHRAPQLAEHASFRELLASGADLVCGSGDKLLGGPQAGLLAGRATLVARCRRHPLYRALRLGRAPAAALEEVLRLHLAGRPLPIDRLWVDATEHRARLERVARALGAFGDERVGIVAADAYVGGGAAPEAPIPGEALALPGDEELARRLRTGEPPVVGYLKEGRLVLDLRTVAPEDDAALVAAARRALEAVGSAGIAAGPAGERR